ncbi:proline-rich transmembrane protein 4 [Rhineura floridana]|uniref:proline-rich transmembrane protein 4 n=1 Tax=Rhineura floridana TaxID=261503 RepID=UPI002AC84459|nr:proline-rich transmembrane protein 4 [Rhineura floridana]
MLLATGRASAAEAVSRQTEQHQQSSAAGPGPEQLLPPALARQMSQWEAHKQDWLRTWKVHLRKEGVQADRQLPLPGRYLALFPSSPSLQRLFWHARPARGRRETEAAAEEEPRPVLLLLAWSSSSSASAEEPTGGRIQPERLGQVRPWSSCCCSRQGPMWGFLLLLCLPSLGSRTPLSTNQSLALTEDKAGHGLQGPSTSSPALPVTPTLLSTLSGAPALSLNLGPNFQIKGWNQGEGAPGGASAKSGLPPTQPAAPTHSQAPDSHFWAEALGGSGGLASDPAGDLPSKPGGWVGNGSSAPTDPDLLGPAPAPQRPLTLWPRPREKGLAVPTAEDSKELEFKPDTDLAAGLGKKGGLAPNGSSSTGQRYPLLPGLSAGIPEIASESDAPGLFGSTLSPEMWEPPERNITSSTREQPGDPRPTPEWGSEQGPESSSLATSPGSEGAFVALPGCLPDRPEDCGSPLPDLPLLFSLPLPAFPLFVPLHSDWDTALEEWGLAWEAYIYGAGALFALLALLSLVGLLGLPCRCPAGGRLLALLHLLLLGAGGARALLLFGDGNAPLELFPDFAVRLLHDLALPCLTSALAIAILLLSPRSGFRTPCLLATVVLLHFSVATGAILAAELLHQHPFLLLASRGVFALLAALLSASFLMVYCLRRGVGTGQACKSKSTSPLPACRCPFADARHWSRAACTALPAASSGLLSAGLHAYAIAHVLGYGLRPQLFGPWPWWALQLACRLCEAGMGLPLAFLGLCPLFRAPSEASCQGCGRRPLCLPPGRVAAKAQALPKASHWALSQHEKMVICGVPVDRSESDCLPLRALPAAEPGDPSEAKALAFLSDPTAGFRPPSPIDLRRSIGEALCKEGLFLQGGGPPSSALSLRMAGEQWPESSLYRTASCVELLPAGAPADREAPLSARRPNATFCPLRPWRGGGSSSSSSGCSSTSPYKHSTEASSLGLSSSPGKSTPLVPPAYGSPLWSPPLPACPPWAPGPSCQEPPAASASGQQGADTAALLQDEFLDACRQIDALSVGSDTVDL